MDKSSLGTNVFMIIEIFSRKWWKQKLLTELIYIEVVKLLTFLFFLHKIDIYGKKIVHVVHV